MLNKRNISGKHPVREQLNYSHQTAFRMPIFGFRFTTIFLTIVCILNAESLKKYDNVDNILRKTKRSFVKTVNYSNVLKHRATTTENAHETKSILTTDLGSPTFREYFRLRERRSVSGGLRVVATAISSLFKGVRGKMSSVRISERVRNVIDNIPIMADIMSLISDEDSALTEIKSMLNNVYSSVKEMSKTLGYKLDLQVYKDRIAEAVEDIENCYTNYQDFIEKPSSGLAKAGLSGCTRIDKNIQTIKKILTGGQITINTKSLFQLIYDYRGYCNGTEISNVFNYLLSQFFLGCTALVAAGNIHHPNDTLYQDKCAEDIKFIHNAMIKSAEFCQNSDCDQITKQIKQIFQSNDYNAQHFTEVIKTEMSWFEFIVIEVNATCSTLLQVVPTFTNPSEVNICYQGKLIKILFSEVNYGTMSVIDNDKKLSNISSFKINGPKDMDIHVGENAECVESENRDRNITVDPLSLTTESVIRTSQRETQTLLESSTKSSSDISLTSESNSKSHVSEQPISSIGRTVEEQITFSTESPSTELETYPSKNPSTGQSLSTTETPNREKSSSFSESRSIGHSTSSTKSVLTSPTEKEISTVTFINGSPSHSDTNDEASAEPFFDEPKIYTSNEDTNATSTTTNSSSEYRTREYSDSSTRTFTCYSKTVKRNDKPRCDAVTLTLNRADTVMLNFNVIIFVLFLIITPEYL